MKKLYSASLFTRTLHAAILAATALAVTAPAKAGECPADKVTADGQKAGATAHKNVTDQVLGSIDLGQEKTGLKDHKFRLRKLVVQPGGEVAWHTHEERPALIHIVSGTIGEYASTCTVPIIHKAGDTAVETHKIAHWWKNTSKEPAVLLSADILHDEADPKHM